jgi:hypothetical protein
VATERFVLGVVVVVYEVVTGYYFAVKVRVFVGYPCV